jgi:hypothetical protein
MGFLNEPHYRIASTELATWLERQGLDVWWTADTDYVLTDRVFVPCPADELIPVLRRLNRTLLVLDPNKNPEAHGQMIGAEDLDALASAPGDHMTFNGEKPPWWAREREFCFCWEGSDHEWELREDVRTTEEERKNAAATQETE